MTPFELTEPASMADAAALLDPDDPAIRPIAGGTALMLMMKSGVFAPKRLISLRAVEKRYSEIETRADGGVRIGALVSLTALEHAPQIRKFFPVLPDTLRTLSNVRVRNVARLGGSLAHGDPHMDLPPLLAALDARVRVIGPSGAREIAVEDLYLGYYETALAGNELIADVVLPKAPTNAAYLKCTTRSADDWPTLGIAANLSLEGETIRGARLVIGAATERITRLKAAEAELANATIGERSFARAAEAAAEAADTIDDARGSASYKKRLVRVYVERTLRKSLGRGAVS